jgi:hypothetical protein
VPFRKYSEAFAPEVLDAMTAAFNAAVQSAQIPPSEIDKKAIADRILASASSGVREVSELTKAALLPLPTPDPCT